MQLYYLRCLSSSFSSFLPSFVGSVSHLDGSSLGLCFQDVTLQILWVAQWSDNWTTACAAQTTLLGELHHILLVGGGWDGAHTSHTEKKREREKNMVITSEQTRPHATLPLLSFLNAGAWACGKRRKLTEILYEQTLTWLFMAILTLMLFLGVARSGLLSNASCFRRAAASGETQC